MKKYHKIIYNILFVCFVGGCQTNKVAEKYDIRPSCVELSINEIPTGSLTAKNGNCRFRLNAFRNVDNRGRLKRIRRWTGALMCKNGTEQHYVEGIINEIKIVATHKDLYFVSVHEGSIVGRFMVASARWKY